MTASPLPPGPPSGLAAHFLAHRPALIRLLTARLGHADEAEDVVQDMWFKLERTPTGPIADPGAYLFRMAANLATDRRLSALRRDRREGAWMEMQPGDHDYPDSERQLLAADELRRVETILHDMPDRMRRALILFRVEQQPHRTIAETFGITVSGVEKLLRRGYRQLVDRMADGSADRASPCRLDDEGSLPDD
ncbi:RNA polymerase sigma factor [Sphingobium sufflavum]|uniref:RNA polymerase sigma factor n=1 Tax=Sphingobium sufflavum TaxID=1129547 RepID=UPI001F2CCFCC|nr:RNA polymerase sigma factor [Sphingobium sufflavum]MCE7796370.1 RNA polymerase sigma factor [Sphingobium sufflavum]